MKWIVAHQAGPETAAVPPSAIPLISAVSTCVIVVVAVNRGKHLPVVIEDESGGLKQVSVVSGVAIHVQSVLISLVVDVEIPVLG